MPFDPRKGETSRLAKAPSAPVAKLRKVRASPPREWVPPRQTLIIATTGRSGSSLLATALTNTNLLGRPGEYFNRIYTHSLLHEDAGSMPELCFVAKKHGETSNGILGLKILAIQFDAIAQEIALSEWFPSIHWLWLRRRDVLGQAISQSIAEQTDAWSSFNAPRAEPVYDATRISEVLIDIVRYNSRWELYFARNGISPILLWYEDFAGDLGPAVLTVAAELRVTLPADTAIHSTLGVQRTGLNEVFRDRYRSEHADLDDLPLLRRP